MIKTREEEIIDVSFEEFPNEWPQFITSGTSTLANGAICRRAFKKGAGWSDKHLRKRLEEEE